MIYKFMKHLILKTWVQLGGNLGIFAPNEPPRETLRKVSKMREAPQQDEGGRPRPRKTINEIAASVMPTAEGLL